jgi:hypothetical protein
MKSAINFVAMVCVVLCVAGTASANYLVEGSTFTKSVTFPNFNTAVVTQRYAGDDAFSHTFFTIYTPFQVNDAEWSFTAPTVADPDHWSAFLLVSGLEVPTSTTSWASSNTINFDGFEVFEGVLDSYSYGSSFFSASLDVRSPLAEASLPTITLSESYSDPSRFSVLFYLNGDFLAVPEPSAIVLMLGGLVGIAVYLRRR